MHADHQGSTIARTDIYGTVTKGYLYNSFGVPANQGFDPYHYTYTGREWDNIFKIFYYRARFYDPEAGRFLSTDPIGFAGGDVNLFAYVQNNPVNWVDPWGLKWYDYISGKFIANAAKPLIETYIQDPAGQRIITAWVVGATRGAVLGATTGSVVYGVGAIPGAITGAILGGSSNMLKQTIIESVRKQNALNNSLTLQVQPETNTITPNQEPCL